MFHTTRQMKNKIDEMQRRMQENAAQNNYNAPKPNIETQKQSEGDYIDYEEVLDKKN